eukprot:1575782-Rhodomonas_salina.1
MARRAVLRVWDSLVPSGKFRQQADDGEYGDQVPMNLKRGESAFSREESFDEMWTKQQKKSESGRLHLNLTDSAVLAARYVHSSAMKNRRGTVVGIST